MNKENCIHCLLIILIVFVGGGFHRKAHERNRQLEDWKREHIVWFMQLLMWNRCWAICQKPLQAVKACKNKTSQANGDIACRTPRLSGVTPLRSAHSAFEKKKWCQIPSYQIVPQPFKECQEVCSRTVSLHWYLQIGDKILRGTVKQSRGPR